MHVDDKYTTTKGDIACATFSLESIDTALRHAMAAAAMHLGGVPRTGWNSIAKFVESTATRKFVPARRPTRRERQAVGIETAKQRGVYNGRKPGTTKAQPQRVRELRERGLNDSEIAAALGISRRTVQRYLKLKTRLR